MKIRRFSTTMAASTPENKRIKIDTGEKVQFEAALNRMTGGDISKEFSEQEKAPQDILERAKKEGVIQKDHNGDWRIVSLKKGTLWNARYQSKAKAKSALSAYHANKRFSDNEEEQNPIQQPQISSKDLQIENMRMKREIMRNQRLQQELAAKERQDAIRNMMRAQKNAAEEKDSDEKNALRAQKAVQGSQDNQPNTGVYKKATIAKAPVPMK
jgi:hypothetical protein